MILHKAYTAHPDGIQELKISISFNKEPINWVNSKPQKIGYYATVVPVRRTKPSTGSNVVIEESGAFTGFRNCILEVDRQSKKRLESAIKIATDNIPTYVKWFEQDGK